MNDPNFLTRENPEASKAFNAGLQAALDVLSKNLNYWQAKRARTHYPQGMVETELRNVEQEILARKK